MLESSQSTGIPRLLRHLNCLALDAPLVGTVWMLFFSGYNNGPIPLFQVTIVTQAIWLVYTADHWFDGQRPYRPGEPARHTFAREYRERIAILWGVVLVTTTTTAFLQGRADFLLRGISVLAVALIYFTAVHASPKLRDILAKRGFKEVATAAFFWAATAIVAQSRPIPFTPLAMGAFGIFLLNALAVSRTERNPSDSVWSNPFLARFWVATAGILIGLASPEFPILAITAATLMGTAAIPGLLHRWPSLADLAITLPPLAAIILSSAAGS